eukprot:386257-Rhodomonas_salina.1
MSGTNAALTGMPSTDLGIRCTVLGAVRTGVGRSGGSLPDVISQTAFWSLWANFLSRQVPSSTDRVPSLTRRVPSLNRRVPSWTYRVLGETKRRPLAILQAGVSKVASLSAIGHYGPAADKEEGGFENAPEEPEVEVDEEDFSVGE